MAVRNERYEAAKLLLNKNKTDDAAQSVLSEDDPFINYIRQEPKGNEVDVCN